MDSNEPLPKKRKGALCHHRNLYVGRKQLTLVRRPCGRKIVAWESHPNSGKFNAKCVHPEDVSLGSSDKFPWLQVCPTCLIDVIDLMANAIHIDETKTGSKTTDWRFPGGKRIFTQTS